MAHYVASTKAEAKQIAREWKKDGKVNIKIRKGPGGEEYYVSAQGGRRNPARNTLTLAALSKGVRGLVKIRKVRNGIRVTVKR